MVTAGKVKVLALTNPQRAASLPDIPTAAEAGFKSLTIDGLTGLFASPGMPLPLRQHIAADIRGIVADPAVAAPLTVTGQVVNPGISGRIRRRDRRSDGNRGGNWQDARYQTGAMTTFAAIGCFAGANIWRPPIALRAAGTIAPQVHDFCALRQNKPNHLSGQ